MPDLNYNCRECDQTFDVYARYFQGDLDELEPDKCPHCQAPVDEKEINKLYEQFCIDSTI